MTLFGHTLKKKHERPDTSFCLRSCWAQENIRSKTMYLPSQYRSKASRRSRGLCAPSSASTMTRRRYPAMDLPRVGPRSQSDTTVCSTSMKDSQTVMALDGTAETFVEDDDSRTYCEVTENIYSIIYTAKFCSPSFWFAVFVFLFQLTIIALILADLVDATNTNNPLQIPPGVVTEVRIAQCLALILSVATQQDILTSLVFLINGYNEDVLESLPSATLGKWLLAGCCHFIAGISLHGALFILLMQSTEVISLFLNFAALQSVAEIDNIGFKMAKYGFVSNYIQDETKRVMELQLPARKNTNVVRRALFLIIVCALMIGYGCVVTSQRSGKFLSQSLRVQFGDDYAPFLPLFSGVYLQTKDDVVDGRVVYLEREGGLGMFMYCEKERAWIFNIGSLDSCDWLVKSPETHSFDNTSTPPSEWVVKTHALSGEPSKAMPIPIFFLSSNDCSRDSTLCVSGTCQDNQCVCDKGRFGIRCEFNYPCPHLQIDFRTPPFPMDFGQLASQYDLLLNAQNRPVQVYDKPVYVFEHLDAGFFDVILFQGRRWVLTNTDLLNVTTPGKRKSSMELAEYLSEEYVGTYTRTVSYFISDAMDIETSSDSYTPVGLRWYRIKTNLDEAIDFNEIDTTQPLETAMLCAVCDDFENRCFASHTCSLPGICECSGDLSGALCELDVEV